MKQNPIVKNNLLNYIEGKDCNAVYDGHTYMPFLLGHSYASCFQHLHDFEPAPRNHWVPHYGVFSKFYFGRMMKSSLAAGSSYAGFKKHHGPPYEKWSAEYDALEHNEYLISKGIKPEEVRHPAAQARLEAGEHNSPLGHAEHH